MDAGLSDARKETTLLGYASSYFSMALQGDCRLGQGAGTIVILRSLDTQSPPAHLTAIS